MFEDRKYLIFNMSEIDTIDFNQVLETSAETVRKSVDETLTFVKWNGENTPPSVSDLTTTQGPYTHSEILSVLSTDKISVCVYGPCDVLRLDTNDGVLPSHLTNVRVSSTDFLIVSTDVSKTKLKLIMPISDILNIKYFLSSNII